MIVKIISNHQPLRSRSCRRRTDTARPGRKKISEAKGPNTPVVVDSSKSKSRAIEDPGAQW